MHKTLQHSKSGGFNSINFSVGLVHTFGFLVPSLGMFLGVTRYFHGHNSSCFSRWECI